VSHRADPLATQRTTKIGTNFLGEQVNIFHLIWVGLWQGLGLEISFFGLWVLWHYAYRRVESKLHPEHLMHKIHEYFTT
jgi:hypothetical protein